MSAYNNGNEQYRWKLTIPLKKSTAAFEKASQNVLSWKCWLFLSYGMKKKSLFIGESDCRDSFIKTGVCSVCKEISNIELN